MTQKGTLVLKEGELFFEIPDTGIGTGHSKIKLGDGKTPYSSLPYALGDTENDTISFTEDASASVDAAVGKVVSGATLKSDIAALKRAINLLAEQAGATYSFSKVTVGTDTITASAVGDNVNLAAGENVTVTADAKTKTVTIAAKDTTYDEATANKAGLMSVADKTKLDGIADGAEVNQNAFSNVKVGEKTVVAGAKTATMTIAGGDNVIVDADTATNTITVSAHDTTYANATTAAAGLMSADDKAKLDGVKNGANVVTYTAGLAGGEDKETVGTITVDGTATKLYAPKNTHYESKTVVAGNATGAADTTAALKNGEVFVNHVENDKVTASHKITGAGTTTVTTDADGNVVVTGIGVEYDDATDAAHGLMSAADKAKLDALGTVSGNDLVLDFGEETLDA